MKANHQYKNALVLAVATASGWPIAAFAQTNVQVYGTLLPFFENAKTSDATAPGLSPATGGATQVPAAAYTGVDHPSRNRLTSGTSNIGFRGTEDLGNGLKAFFQVESGAPVDGQGPNTFASRNSGVGLAGEWGTVLLGIWDTPYKIGHIVTVA